MVVEVTPGRPMAHNLGLLCLNDGLLWSMMDCYFGLLGCFQAEGSMARHGVASQVAIVIITVRLPTSLVTASPKIPNTKLEMGYCGSMSEMGQKYVVISVISLDL